MHEISSREPANPTNTLSRRAIAPAGAHTGKVVPTQPVLRALRERPGILDHWSAVSAALVQRFSRVTSSGEFIPEIDGPRFIAITAVIFHHLIAHYLTATQRMGPVCLPADWYQVYSRSRLVSLVFPGYFGVHLFFVISGFILALPFARH